MRLTTLTAALLLAGLPARADTILHMKSQVYGCEKARAARALNNQADPRQSDPKWVAYVMGDGQCVRITTQSAWAVVGGDDNGVTLVSYRGTMAVQAPSMFRRQPLISGACAAPSRCHPADQAAS